MTYETDEQFAARVVARTGVTLEAMPRRTLRPGELPGHIFCKRGAQMVVGVGYPDYEDPETGVPYWSRFEVVDVP